MWWRISLPILLAVVAVGDTPARAADLGAFVPRLCWPDGIRKVCCDDYCPKPMPCVPRVCCFGCDDYQSKCAPVVRRLGCFGCDDYCPKCPPAIRCGPSADLKCVPLRDCR